MPCLAPQMRTAFSNSVSRTRWRSNSVRAGGTHLLPAKDDQISSIAVSLRDNWSVRYLAPVHCTGEPAFAILKETFGDRYIYAGLGTTVLLGPKVTVKAEAGQPNRR